MSLWPLVTSPPCFTHGLVLPFPKGHNKDHPIITESLSYPILARSLRDWYSFTSEPLTHHFLSTLFRVVSAPNLAAFILLLFSRRPYNTYVSMARRHLLPSWMSGRPLTQSGTRDSWSSSTEKGSMVVSGISFKHGTPSRRLLSNGIAISLPTSQSSKEYTKVPYYLPSYTAFSWTSCWTTSAPLGMAQRWVRCTVVLPCMLTTLPLSPNLRTSCRPC